MIEAIAFLLLGLSALGLLSVVALITAFIATSRSDRDLYLDERNCDCYLCCSYEPIDACSSECDKDCRDNDHYPGQDWRR